MYGYAGKILRIDLSNEEVKTESIREDFALNFLGGKGFGTKILYEEMDPRADPLGPGNLLIISTGPLNGLMPLGGKFEVIFKSPLTGAYADSNIGGHFGPELKFAGYDIVVIKGIAPRPTYIWIDDDQVEFRDANHIWGKTTEETERIIRDETKDETVRVCCIGPAGEHLVRYASIISDGHAAGRCGGGAVMGSKNLKAIAVRGTKSIKALNPEKIVNLIHGMAKKIKESPVASILSRYGSPAGITISNELGTLVTKNAAFNIFDKAKDISAEALFKYRKTSFSCFGCPAGCTHYNRVEKGMYAGSVALGPEYETLALLGSNCLNDNVEAIIKIDQICDQCGMDTISLGNVIGFIMECYEKGIISKKDLEGLEMTWGNHEAMVEAAKKIAYRIGIGDLLAEGVARISNKLGKDTEKFSMHVKGLELPAWESRGLEGQGLSYATSERGGCHLRAAVHAAEALGLRGFSIDRYDTKGKPKLVKEMQDAVTVINSLILCEHFTDWTLKEPADLINAVTGWNITSEELFKIGERILNVARLFNVRAGFSVKDDTLPYRMLREPVPSGPSRGHVVHLDKMLSEYYRLRGWSKEGVPTEEKIRELNIHELIHPSWV